MHRTSHTGRLTALTLALCACSSVALAADPVELSLDQLPFNTAGQVGVAKASAEPSAVNALKALIGRNESFALQAERKTGAGEVLERGQQTYKGVPVHGAEFIATRDQAGKYTFVNGTLLRNIDRDLADVTPKLSAHDAARAAKRAWFGNAAVPGQKAELAERSERNWRVNFEREPQLLVYRDAAGKAVLAWRIEFGVPAAKSGQLPKQPLMFIDAKTGAVIAQFDNLHTAEEAGSGPGGNQRMGQIEHSSSGSGLAGATLVTKNGTTCTLSNSSTRVMDAAGSTNTGSTTPKSYTCSTAGNRFVEAQVNGAYGVLNDILFNGTKTVEMYRAWFNVAPHPHCSGALRQYGHYDRNLDNAFWQNCTMSYGDGNTFHPLVSMDVVAHEVSHGVTEARSNLQYSGQSGGLNESFSDIAGTAAIYYVGANVDWKIGSMIKKSSGQMRCMDDPTCDGRSIKHVSSYTSGMDVHHSSGVYNHAFYLLATKPGWNVKKAFEVYFRANANYWTSSASFAQAAEGVCKAAKDLGYSETDVKASLTAIGTNPTSCTGGGGGTPTDTTLSNGTAVTGNYAAQESKYFVLDVPAGASNLSFTTTGSNGDVDLYVKFGSRPSTTDNSCKSEGQNSNETCTISSIQTGKYYVLVYGYAASTSVSVKGSYSTGGGGGGDTVLSNGVAVTGISLAANAQRFFTLAVPSGASNLKFVSSGGSGDVDIYVKFGSKPTTTSYDCKSDGSSNAETCNISSAQSGTYYVLMNAYSASSNVSLTGSYSTGGGGGSCSTLPVWNANTTYYTGNKVQYNGRQYQAKTTVWYWAPTYTSYWTDLGACN